MEDFDKYLNGEMSGGERSRFEEQLARDPDLQTELRVREGLRQLRLQKKVAEAAAARKQWEHRRNWRRIGAFALLAGLVVSLAVFVFVKNETIPPANPPETMSPAQSKSGVEPIQPTVKEDVEPVLPEKKTTNPIQQPIADTKPLPDRLTEKPVLRSAYQDLDAATFQLLDSLLTWTRQSPKADGNWKNVMQSFAEGKPSEAKSTIFQLEKTDAAEAKWLLALALLAQGKMEEAMAIFESIARSAGNPRQAAAKAAVEKLKE